MPKWPRARPDFQAPGPRVLVEKTVSFEEAEADQPPDESDEVEELASYGPPKALYYESDKVLGKLYRDIDEHKFFEDIDSLSQRTELTSYSLIEAVWSYVKKKTALIQWQHYIEFAKDVKEKYVGNSEHLPK